MTPARQALPRAFKRAVILSALLHVGLCVLIVASPSFSRSRAPKGLVQYVNFIGGGGGGGTAGGGTGGGTVVAKTEPLPAPKKPALRDLTVASKLKPEPTSALTHPVDKPKTAKKKPADKKATITKPAPAAPTAADAVNAAAAQSGSGFGLRFGTG